MRNIAVYRRLIGILHALDRGFSSASKIAIFPFSDRPRRRV
jgi:hypothetical protein